MPGDEVAVITSTSHWLNSSSVRGSSHRLRGWIPRGCIKAGSWRRNEVPHQSRLQGYWETAAGAICQVRGCLVFVAGGSVPFVVRAWPEGSSTVGSSSFLLGCKLRSCGDREALWEILTGDGQVERTEVWQRLEVSEILEEDEATSNEADPGPRKRR